MTIKQQKRIRFGLLLSLIVLGGGAWMINRPRDLVFRGKPESEWIKNLKYSDDDQVKEWQAYGEEGVQVLIRGLRTANHPGERAYRSFRRRLPSSWWRWLPEAKADATQGTRHSVVSLISRLGTNAEIATAVMIETVRDDENPSVRQSAIHFFTSSEDENSLLNRMPPRQKQAVLPALIRAIQDPGDWGLRNNAALALKCYPEERNVVAPVLANALRDSQPQVRLLAAKALNRVDPETAKQAGATSVLIAIAKGPDAQTAPRAVEALGLPGIQIDLAVPVLVESLRSTNTNIGCQAASALGMSRREFAAYSNEIIPALGIAAERRDNVGGWAKKALARWTSDADTQPRAE